MRDKELSGIEYKFACTNCGNSIEPREKILTLCASLEIPNSDGTLECSVRTVPSFCVMGWMYWLVNTATRKSLPLLISKVRDQDGEYTPEPGPVSNVSKMLAKGDDDPSKKRGFEREPRRTRTSNLLIKSQLLCQLS